MTTAPYNLATHNGTITIENPATRQHRTFSIRTQPEDAKFAPGQRIVALLTGPCNESDYQGFGFVAEDGTVLVWRSKRGGDFEKFADMLANPVSWMTRTGVNYLFEGRCIRCNRKLTTPESIRTGIGPVCAGRE